MASLSRPGKSMRTLGMALLALVCSLTFSECVHAQTFNQIQFVIGTGDDDSSVEADTVARAKGKATWGEDRRQ